MKRSTRVITSVLLVLGLACTATACGIEEDANRSAEDVSEQEIRDTAKQLLKIQASDPVLQVDYSQVHRTLNVAEYLAATGAQTHTFFMHDGVADPYFDCPTAGFPVPGSWSLTNPWQEDPNTSASYGVVVAQAEPTLGVYTADTLGTWVICIAPNGEPFVRWAEGYAEGGFPPGTTWDYENHRAVLPGDVPPLDVEVTRPQG